MEQFIVSARKYRPNSFESMIGQDNISTTLKNSILRGQLAHAYLFCGPRGVGKTTTARIFAKSINCLNPSPDMEPCGKCESCLSFSEGRSYCIHELDAASNNSVDDIRNLTEMVRIPPQIGKYSVYIIDEVHMLSTAAFNAFLKTLEEPPAYAIFILATTEKHKILPTILSRCQTYDFNRISIPDMVTNLTEIAQKEGIQIEEDALHIIAQKADGAMRDALTLFDQTVAFCGKEIKYEQVIANLNILDYEYYFRLVDHFLAGDFTSSLLIFDELLSKGFNALHFVSGLSTHLRDLIVSKKEASQTLLQLPASLIKRYKGQGEKCSVQFLYEALGITTNCEAAYKQSGNQRLLIEFALMKLSFAAKPQNSVQPAPSPAPAVIQTPSASSAPASAHTTAPAKPAPATAPVSQEATPQPASAQKGETRGGISLKEMLRQAEQRAMVKEDKKEVTKDKGFTFEEFIAVWEKIIAKEQQSANVLLATQLKQYTPTMGDDNFTVTFYVSNEAQCQWVKDKRLLKYINFAREELSDSRLDLKVEVAPSDANNERQKYMSEKEKAEYLLNKSEELRELKTALDLDIK